MSISNLTDFSNFLKNFLKFSKVTQILVLFYQSMCHNLLKIFQKYFLKTFKTFCKFVFHILNYFLIFLNFYEYFIKFIMNLF